MSWKFGFILFCLSYVYGDEELNDNTLWKYMKSWSPWSWDEVKFNQNNFFFFLIKYINNVNWKWFEG